MSVINRNTLITGLIALAVGVGIGVAATELKTETPGAPEMANSGTNPLSAAAPPNTGATGQTWDPFQEIRDMQLQTDRMFSRMSEQFRMEPQFNGLAENPGYSVSLNVRELKDRFEVTAFLPDARASDVSVKLENNQTLKVSVSNRQTETSNGKSSATRVAEWGQYAQVIRLPAPVKADQMKIERKNHELIITLPKE